MPVRLGPSCSEPVRYPPCSAYMAGHVPLSREPPSAAGLLPDNSVTLWVAAARRAAAQALAAGGKAPMLGIALGRLRLRCTVCGQRAVQAILVTSAHGAPTEFVLQLAWRPQSGDIGALLAALHEARQRVLHQSIRVHERGLVAVLGARACVMQHRSPDRQLAGLFAVGYLLPACM